MKKIFCLLLSIVLVFSMFGCGNNTDSNTEDGKTNDSTNNDSNANVDDNTNEETKNDENTNYNFNFYHDVKNWDELETKENVELKLCGVSDVPFKLTDFNGRVAELSSYMIFSTDSENILDYDRINDFSMLIDGTRLIKPNYHPESASHSINISLDNGAKFELCLTATKEEEHVAQNILNAVDEGRHYYYSNPTHKTVDKFLDIDMTGVEITSVRGNPNFAPLLDKIIEKFGKPTTIDMYHNVINEYIGMQYYDLIYEFEEYTLVVNVSENLAHSDGEVVEQYISLGAFVFAPTAWEQYSAYHADN